MTCLIELKKYRRIYFVMLVATVCCCLLLLRARNSLASIEKISFITGNETADVFIVLAAFMIVAGIIPHRKYKSFLAVQDAHQKVNTHYTYFVYELTSAAILLPVIVLGLIIYDQNWVLTVIPAASIVRNFPTQGYLRRDFKNCELLFV
jgi:hypothetical protein